MLRKVRLLPFLPLALLVVLVVRALRPLVRIRFGVLPNSLIGHFAANTEVYLCERDAGMHGRRAIDIFYYGGLVSNQQLKKMFNRKVTVAQFVGFPDRLNRRLPGGRSHLIPWQPGQDRDIHGLLAHSKAHLVFTEAEERSGREAMRKLGIPENASFMCFHTRDSAYRAVMFPGRDDTHHEYRNASILSYLPAADELARRGYFALRMGALVKEPVPAADGKVIDYASNSRTDFLDIYLTAKCAFFLGCHGGIDAVAKIFRRPTIYANTVPLGHVPTWGPDDLIIPKKLWLREEGRYLSIREIVQSEIGGFLSNEQYDQLGIEVIENTPEEITAVAIEMDERLKGTWETTEGDKELQSRFFSLFQPDELNRTFQSRIGADFLRQNRDLLD